jgi:4-oxalomesaconate tautomerase
VNRDGVRCMLMRGGTSKGLYFVAADRPEDPADRDALPTRGAACRSGGSIT